MTVSSPHRPWPSFYLPPRGINKPQNKSPDFFFFFFSFVVALPLSASPRVVFSFCVIPRGRRRCGGNWQPSWRRSSAGLLICMALIVDWSLQPQIYDELSPPSLSLALIRSIFSPPPLNILPLHFPHAIKKHFSSIFLHSLSLSLDESTEPSFSFSHRLCALLSLSLSLSLSPSRWETSIHLCSSSSSTCSVFFTWALSSRPAVFVLWAGFMYPFFNKQKLNNAVSMPHHLSYLRQQHFGHTHTHTHTHIYITFFFNFTWQHNPAMLLFVIYETKLKGCEGSLLPSPLSFLISLGSVCVCCEGEHLCDNTHISLYTHTHTHTHCTNQQRHVPWKEGKTWTYI